MDRLLRGLPGHPLHPPLTDATIAFALLLVVALLGFTMLAIWLARRRATAAESAPPTPLPGEQHFPVPIVVLHGIAAATTLVLVFLTNIGVG